MQLRTALGQLPALNPPHVGAVGAAQVRRQAQVGAIDLDMRGRRPVAGGEQHGGDGAEPYG
jgi:hypothetical protein